MTQYPTTSLGRMRRLLELFHTPRLIRAFRAGNATPLPSGTSSAYPRSRHPGWRPLDYRAYSALPPSLHSPMPDRSVG